MNLNLENRVAVVTGGVSGIGRAVAESFADEGARVAIWDLSDSVADAAEQIEKRTDRPAIGITVDVSNQATVAHALRETEEQLGSIDHLVHAAAIGSGQFGFPFTELEPDHWRKVLDVNVMGMVNVAHAVAPGMADRGAGSLVFIASVAGQIGSQTDPPYSASKAANINFAQCMAKDLAPHGVRVNSLCPGMVQTPLNEGVWQAWNDRQPPAARRSYEDWAGEKIRNVVPLGRWQQPADIADMTVFLCSDRAAQITGQTINVDGGFVMHS